MAENALPVIGSRSAEGVAVRPKERGERRSGPVETGIREGQRTDITSTRVDRLACLSLSLSLTLSLVRVSLELFVEDLHRGVSIP